MRGTDGANTAMRTPAWARALTLAGLLVLGAWMARPGWAQNSGKDTIAEVTVEGNRLRISGNRPDGCRSPKCSFIAMEINYGPFESVLELPPGYDLSQAKAAYLNGFLRIDVPLVQRPAKHTQVPIAEGN